MSPIPLPLAGSEKSEPESTAFQLGFPYSGAALPLKPSATDPE